MKNLVLIATLFTLSACATGKLGKVDKALDTSLVTKNTSLMVRKVTTKNINFSGDKSEDKVRTTEEKENINQNFGKMLITELRKKGYQAKKFSKKTTTTTGFVITGNVRKFEHGSAAARGLVGFGAGSSNMFTDFTITDAKTGQVVSKFEIIATSGGRGGFSAMGSFMEAHLTDGAEKAAQYITGQE